MPGTVRGAVAVDTFPISLSTKFVETRTCMPRINEYRDGSTQRSTLVMEARRSWSLAKRLTPSNLATLRAFWEANPNTAFGFYDPFETNPPFTKTPFGTIGYYLVKFASDWEETIGMARSDASVELIEVSANPAGAPATAQGVIDFVLHGAITSVTLNILTSHVLGTPSTPDLGAICTIDGLGLFSRGWLSGGGAWTLRTDTLSLSPTSILGLVAIFALGTASPGSFSSPEQFLVYDVWIDVVYSDLTTRVFRPTSARADYSVWGTPGDVVDPGNAIDNSTSTFATVQAFTYATVNFGGVLVVSGFAPA